MNKPVFLGQPILDQGEILMYELTTCKPKKKKKVNLCHMEPERFVYENKIKNSYQKLKEM